MKKIFILILALSPVFSYSQSGMASLDDQVEVLLKKQDNKTITEKEKGELRNYIYRIQNTGFNLSETEHDYKNALLYTDKALVSWIRIKDTLGEANNRKYRGFLLGKLNRFSEAHTDIEQAIYLYSIKNNAYGIAVSHFDFSKLYEFENKFDSAFYHINLALSFWKVKKDTARILGNSTQLQNLFYKTNQFTKAEKIQKECVALAGKQDLYWQELVDHYYVSILLFDKLKKHSLAEGYRQLLNAATEKLKADGINARSTYQID